MSLIWKMDQACMAKPEQRIKHINHALSLGLPEFFPTDAEQDKDLVICASGPSLRTEFYCVEEAVEAGHHVMVINGAHDFMIERGIIPEYAMSIDPQAETWKNFSIRDYDIHYFLASQCHEFMFEQTCDKRVTLFHLLGDTERKHLKKHRCYFVGGGSTSGLRAMTLAYLMGYKKQHLIGYDSCYLYGQRNVDKPMDRAILNTEVNEKDFYTNPEFAVQADEFQDVLESLPEVLVRVYGEGMIAEIMKVRKQHLNCKHAA